MCINCGYNPCSCPNPVYSFNWYNTDGLPCSPCSDTEVCKKNIPAKCTMYKGPNLTTLGLTSPVNIELIISTIDTFLATLQSTITANSVAQATKNANILTALNDINTRINTITAGSHAPYTI